MTGNKQINVANQYLYWQIFDFSQTDIARVLEVPGLHEFLRTAILTQISNYMILPNKITTCLSSSVVAAQLRHVDPKVGILYEIYT